ncbi:MAG: glyoxalase/bleomycin resistance/dioxygenase family protein [Rubrivivax sp.]
MGPEDPASPAPGIAAVMVHVPDPLQGLHWYAAAFPQARLTRLDEQDFEFLALGALRIEVVRSDEKVASGAAGSVVYWQVADFDRSLQHLLGLGASLYRGPMAIEGGQRMCQLRDPWGNCPGIRG